jgi:hypothetical protein
MTKNQAITTCQRRSVTRVWLLSVSLILALAGGDPATSEAATSAPSAPVVASPVRTGTPSTQVPTAALQRQMMELQRAQHLLELSAGNDRASHSAVAARHVQMAINELKLELQKRARASTAKPGKVAGSGNQNSPISGGQE